MSILKPNQIKFGDIFNQIREYLIKKYAQAGDVFSPASAYGQILNVMQSFYQMAFLYIEDAIVEQNITTASKLKSIQGFARLTGHNPTRGISAQGTINVKWKPNSVDLNCSWVKILDKAKLTCDNNSLPYFVVIGNSTGFLTIDKTDINFIPLKIIQGEVEQQTKIGTGLALQSYNFQSNKPIDNDNVSVFVNGVPFEIVDSIYDMIKGEKLCMVKTGIYGGIDLYFGNEDYGYMPPEGSTILVEYVKTAGFGGNVFGKSSSITFKWVENATSNTGEEVDLNEYMNITVEKPLILGSDPEDSNLTKLIAPFSSRSFVLANPTNYVALLSRFNYSFVDAYIMIDDEYLDDDNVIYLFLIPDIKRRLRNSSDYFTTNLENFYLDPAEKEGVYKYVNQTGQQVISSELEIVDPILTKYVINVFLRVYESYNEKSIYNEVIGIITDYALSVRRRDKVPKSDLVALIENVKGVDSVNISFVSEYNEKAINDGYYIQKVTSFDNIRGIMSETDKKITVSQGTDPNLGLDDFGDIKIGKNEMPVFRGGWYDRFGNQYEDGLSTSHYSSVNVVIKEVIKETVAIKQMNSSKTALK